MRERSRRKNFKIGDPCDGFNPKRANTFLLSKRYEEFRHKIDHVFAEQYFWDDNTSLMLKQTVYSSKLVLALCEK